MITLAFDTCLDKMYVVLKKDETILASRVVETTESKYHSAYLISTIQEVLSQNNIKPQNIDLIGVNIGPGSFTGIRACVTVARVMAQQLNCKAVGVSSLEILANTCPPLETLPSKQSSELFARGETKSMISSRGMLVALDARKNAAYLYLDGEIKGAIQLEEVQEKIKSDNYTVITDDRLQPLLGGISYQKEDFKLGEILAELAEEKITDGDWRKLKPLYIQPPPMG